ncbi:MAG TPA: MFS transporter [Kofleriaceae bacterium]|nr:MFS transporter [Kofleriaceae bacterium]
MPDLATQDRLLTPAMLLLGVTLFLGALVPNLFVLAPRYLAERGYDAQQIGVIMSGFNLAALIAMPLAGRLTEAFGHRALLAAGCLIAALGAALFDVSSGPMAYTAARCVQGLGFAAVLVVAAAYVAEIAPERRLAQALGVSGVLTLVSQAAGPAIGEVLEHAAGWRAVFWAGVGAGVLGAIVALLLPPVRARAGTASPPAFGAWPVLIATALAGFGFGAVWSFLSDYATRVHLSAVTPFFAAYVLAAVGTRLGLGHLPDLLGHRRVAVPALVGHGLALLAMSQLGASWHMVVIGAVFGLSHGFYYPTLQAMVLERSVVRPRAIAAHSMAFSAGIVVSSLGLGAVAKWLGYPLIYVVAAAAGMIAAALVATRS